MKNLKKFDNFLSEATLRGNPAFPGEDPNKSEDAFIDAILSANREEAQRMMRETPSDISNLMGNVGRANNIQRGHEQELSELAEEVIREVYGTFIDDIILDLKIVNRPVQDLKDKMKECKNCQLPNIEELDDQRIIDEINRRKIIRTIQQGKGLNVKEIINLPSVAKRLKEILGEVQGEQYRILANKIAAGAHFYDLTLTPEQKSSMFRNAPPGACDIEISKPKTEEEQKVDPEEILKDIQEEGEINPEMEEVLEGTESKVIARAMDFGLLIHESVKGIYKLITQALLMQVSDSLGLDAAEIVKANTETLFDEIEEQSIGKVLQRILGLVINSNSKVEEIIAEINSSDDFEASASETAAFMEQLHWLVYGKLSQVQPAKKCLEIFNGILKQVIDPTTKKLKTLDQISNIMDRSMIDPIINECLEDMEAEKKYQEHIAKYGKDSGKGSAPNPPEDKGKFGGFNFGGFGLN